MRTRSEAFKASASYFALVFVAGFLLGVVRTFLVETAIGETAAVLLELPFMLAISWIACRWTIYRFRVPSHVGDRIVMGVSALLILLTAEAMLSVGFAGLSLQQHFALYLKLAAQLGLLGQMLFAMFPLIQLKLATSQDRIGRMQ